MEDYSPPRVEVKQPKRLPLVRRMAYGVGHVLNDLCASVWFSYLLLYFHKVLNFSNAMAGGVLLLGQVCDGICTPLIGYESDMTKSGLCNYGRRKSWHLIGSLCVIGSFTFIYQPIFGGVDAEDWARFIYYAPFVAIFQFGWAATQISHLSLIPELTTEDGERVELNAIRYAFTVMASIFVYLVTFLLLHLQSSSSDGASLNPDVIPQFRYLVIIVVAVGTIFVVLFHVGTKEPKGGRRRLTSVDSCSGSIQAGGRPKLGMKWSDWFKEPHFYQITALYMCTRLMVNLSQIYIPMYVTDTLKLDKESIALVPLVVYFSGFLSTFVAKPVNKYCGRKLTYFIGALLFIGACVWMAFPKIGFMVYGAAILLGVGGSTVLVTSLAFTADLIGHNTESGAFVYGAMSLTDKISNGVAVQAIQLLQPCVHCCPACGEYYQDIVSYVTGGAAVGAVLVLATLVPVTVGKRRKKYCKLESGTASNSYEDMSSQRDDCTIPGADKRPLPQANGVLPQPACRPSRELETCAEVHSHAMDICPDGTRENQVDGQSTKCAYVGEGSPPVDGDSEGVAKEHKAKVTTDAYKHLENTHLDEDEIRT